MTDQSTAIPPPSLELRVVNGPLQGAATVLDCSRSISVGTASTDDIVLRDYSEMDCGILLSRVGSTLRLIVARGSIRLAGESVQAGDERVLPLFTPVQLGKHVIAVGSIDALEWADIDIAGVSRIEPTTPAKPHGAIDWLRNACRWLLPIGAMVSVLSISFLALAYATTPAMQDPLDQLTQTESALRDAGFLQLKATTDANGAIVITGYLDASSDRAKLEQLMARKGLSARLDIAVNNDLVAAVRDVLRMHGVTADVSANGPGVVAAITQEADEARLALVKAAARRDIPSLIALDFHNTPPPTPPDVAPLITDPGKRIASIVPSDAPYVVTVDGTRYFEGALLPTGHRITAIREREVALERGGNATSLRF